MTSAITAVGIDAGGTLIKAAIQKRDRVEYMKFSAASMKEAVRTIMKEAGAVPIGLTGGRSAVAGQYLNREVHTLVEFEATCKGVQYLLRKQGDRLRSFVMTNVGTGTSIHYIDGQQHERIGGIGVGGGTLIGLSYLMTGVSEYNEIIQCAKEGNRAQVDLKVSDIYEGLTPPISGDLTASNFGKPMHLRHADISVSDKLLSIIGLIGETVTTVSVMSARELNVTPVVYIGSSFIDNEPLKEIVAGYTALRGSQPYFVHNGEYSGAVGAMLSVTDNSNGKERGAAL